jgi:hypothetical protein
MRGAAALHKQRPLLSVITFGAEAPEQTELPFMCLMYGEEEAAKHPVPTGKFVKVQCVHKSVPRIIE